MTTLLGGLDRLAARGKG